MSNFPLSYRLSWLPRLLKPSLAGNDGAFSPLTARWLQPRSTVRLAFLGDISAVANAEPPEIDPELREAIAGADLVVANCESPVVARPAFPFSTRLGLRHAMTPAFLDRVLEAAGIAPARLLLSLANNHALDQGVAGFEETVAGLAGRGITVIGTAAGGPVQRVEAGPLRLGFLAFTRWRNAAASDFAGRVVMQDAMGRWRECAPEVDLLCAVPHWDLEFRHFPQAQTRALAQKLVRQGVGLVVGGHAHVVQPVEAVDGALVAYGLGDFLGTVAWRTPWPTRIGAVLSVKLSADDQTRGQVAAYRVLPFLRERRGRHERLVPVERYEGPEAGKMKDRLAAVFAQADGAFERSALFMLDEVDLLGYMRVLEEARDRGRKYGITLMLMY